MEKIQTQAEEKQLPVFHSAPLGEHEEMMDTVERTTGRESRTECERWLEGGQETWDEGDGALADDEDDDDDDDDGHQMSSVFTPLVKIVRKTDEKQMESYTIRADDVRADDVRADDVRADDVRADDVRADDVRADDVRADVSMHWKNTEQIPQEHNQRCCQCCGEMMSSVIFLLLGLMLFPLLVWGGHDLLPLDLPAVRSAPSRLVYTLRCAFFATFPIILGVFVHGVSCLKFSFLNPLFEGKRASRHTIVHMTFVQDSLRLFLLFFVQLAVTSTYIHKDNLKLVPLLTIIYVFGRLIYWLSVCLGSTVRALGFSLSFLPVLTLMGLNLYFVCSSTGEGAVFDVALPTTPPPPKARWWG